MAESTFAKEELELIFRQEYQAVHLDYTQYTMLSPEFQATDVEFIARQQLRFSIMTKIKDMLGEKSSEELSSLYEDVLGIMLLVRGVDNAKCGQADRATT